jgi:TolA-binding protein
MHDSKRLRWYCAVALLVSPVVAFAQGASTELARQHLESGTQFYEQGRYNQALNDFQIIVTSMADTEYADDALLRIGRYYLDIEEDFEQAKTNLDALLQRYPTGNAAPGAYYYLGEVVFRSDRTGRAIDDALANYQRVFIYANNPWIPAALYSTGLALERQGKFQEAVDAYYQVIVDHRRSEWSAGALLGVGRASVRQGQPIEAMAQFQEVRNVYPESGEADAALDWLTLLFRFYGAPLLGESVSFRRDDGFTAGVSDELKDVKALRISESGIHVLERGRKRVVTFDWKGQVAGTRAAADGYGLAVDPRGQVVIANEKGLVLDGTPRSFMVQGKDGPEPLEKIRWAVRDRLGEVYVYDEKQKKILRFDESGRELGVFPDATPREVLAMEVDQRGNIVLLDKKDRDVMVYSPEGRVLARIPTKRGGQLNFKEASDIALDPAGYLYILDEDQAQIAVFDAAYQHLTTLTTQSLGSGALQEPVTLDVDASGDLYVYDKKSKAIVRLQ